MYPSTPSTTHIDKLYSRYTIAALKTYFRHAARPRVRTSLYGGRWTSGLVGVSLASNPLCPAEDIWNLLPFKSNSGQMKMPSFFDASSSTDFLFAHLLKKNPSPPPLRSCRYIGQKWLVLPETPTPFSPAEDLFGWANPLRTIHIGPPTQTVVVRSNPLLLARNPC